MDSKIGVVYFSKNRPLQLDLAISSNKLCCKDWDSIAHYVIYTADEPYKKAYNTLISEHPDCEFIKETVFKDNLLSIVKKIDYIVFSVDDVIYTTDYFISNVAETLYNTKEAIGFSLRLGYNTTFSFAQNKEHITPDFSIVGKSGEVDILKYNWITEVYNADFGFPLEVSGTLYRARDLLFIMSNTKWDNPNTLELALYSNVQGYFYLPEMLCFEKSTCFSAPLNKVYLDNNNNRTGDKEEYSVENLLSKYEDGFRIKSDKFYNFLPTSPHQEISLF